MNAVGDIPATPRRRHLGIRSTRPGAELPSPAGPGSVAPATSRAARRLVGRWVPYALSSPALLVLAAIVGFPLVFCLVVSFQKFGGYQLVTGGPTLWVGFSNYQRLFTTDFVPVLIRTLLFTAGTVGMTLIIGMGLAMLMRRAHTWARVLLTVVLVIVWAVPQVTSSQIFIWIFDPAYGVVNWVLSSLHLGSYASLSQHQWYNYPVSVLALGGAIVVWGAVPFVAITLFAGLLQIPEELYEAARVDGAGFMSQLRTITLPLLLPILLLLGVLSIIWDFNVYNQIYVLQQVGGISSETTTFGIWGYNEAFVSNNYAAGGAVTMIGVLLLLLVTGAAVRMMVRGART
ncbi:MAG TPA: sugar ABC transporter permease [Candidatus Binatia bacterium]|nr:sugar ABC transporter permease [Candidatus Binatia bacterium]